jgi:hypothetical protein
MSKHGSGRLFIRVVCTDRYIDQQTGIRCARHQKFRLGRLPAASASTSSRPSAISRARQSSRRGCTFCGVAHGGPVQGRRQEVGQVWTYVQGIEQVFDSPIACIVGDF